MAYTLRHTTPLTMTTGQVLASGTVSDNVSHMIRLHKYIQIKVYGKMAHDSQKTASALLQ